MFDPAEHLLDIGTKKKPRMYLEVKWRVVWLREQYPEAEISTEILHIDLDREVSAEVSEWDETLGKTVKVTKHGKGLVIFKATIKLGNGAIGTGTKMENAAAFGDWLEKAECVPLDSEIFTRQGFKRYDELIIGEEVLAYDPNTDRCVWTPLQRVVTYPSAPLVRLHGKHFEAYCTPEHTWPVYYTANWKGRKYEYRKLMPTNQLNKNHRIILSAPGPDSDYPLTSKDAAILGWIMTDGNISNHRSYIAQSKQDNVAIIRELVGGLASESVFEPTVRTFPSGRTYDCLPQHRFTFNASETRRLLSAGGFETSQDMPLAVIQYSQDARNAMLNAMMLGDGDKRGYFGKKRKPGVMEAWQNIATLEGYALSAMHTSTAGDVPIQRLKKRRMVCASELEIEPVGNVPVWCPTTAYGTWVMRQNGRIMITGNTGAIGRALASLGLGTAATDEMSEGEGHVVDAPVDRKPSYDPDKPCTEQQVQTINRLQKELGMAELASAEGLTFGDCASMLRDLNKRLQTRRKAS